MSNLEQMIAAAEARHSDMPAVLDQASSGMGWGVALLVAVTVSLAVFARFKARAS